MCSARDHIWRRGSPTPSLSPPSQELRQAREAQRELAAEKRSQEELLRQRERELAALKGTMEQETSSRAGELERYRRDLQQLREERDEATKVGARGGAAPAAGCPPPSPHISRRWGRSCKPAAPAPPAVGSPRVPHPGPP